MRVPRDQNTWRWRQYLGAVAIVFVLFPLLLSAGAQQAGKMPKVAYVVPAPPDCKITPMGEAFQQGLRDHGYVLGHTIVVERRCYRTEDQLRDVVREVIQLKVDVIVAVAHDAALAAQRATRTIPIVMLHHDPVGMGLVKSLAHPGSNITGVSTLADPEVAAKRLEFLKAMAPGIASVAVLLDPAGGPQLRKQSEVAARRLGLHLQILELRGPEDVEPALAAILRGRSGGVVAQEAPAITTSRRRIIAWVAQNRLPAIFFIRIFVDDGGLMSYGRTTDEVYRRLLATYVDKILKGAKPADLPVEQPAKYELAINAKTAKALGFPIQPSLLLQATHVIE